MIYESLFIHINEWYVMKEPELSCMICYATMKIWDFIYICMFTCIKVLPFYDEYEHVHYETEMIIVLSIVQQ